MLSKPYYSLLFPIFTRGVAMNQARIFDICRYIIGVYFIFAGAGKIIDSTTAEPAFLYVLEDFRIFLPENPRTIAIGASIIEILIGGILLRFRNGLIPLFFVLGANFLTYGVPIAQTITKQHDIPVCSGMGFFDFGLPPRVALVKFIVLYAVMMWMMFYAQYILKEGYQGIFAKSR
ncbi:MAG: hypothetical protein EAZ92_01120 [Candidatus Kapaibacterium sp.]|nr:MAG: hypothetical protein EAZ92_01120 [Candidatus Kapabacteria bacterium]